MDFDDSRNYLLSKVVKSRGSIECSVSFVSFIAVGCIILIVSYVG